MLHVFTMSRLSHCPDHPYSFCRCGKWFRLVLKNDPNKVTIINIQDIEMRFRNVIFKPQPLPRRQMTFAEAKEMVEEDLTAQVIDYFRDSENPLSSEGRLCLNCFETNCIIDPQTE